MATSGVITFSQNARDTIVFALKLIGAIDANASSVSAQEMEDGRVLLNLMLKEWQVVGPNVWRSTTGSVTMVDNTSTYTLSPRPVKVHSVRFRDANGRDLPMWELTEEEYEDQPLKSSNGVPTQYFLDKQSNQTQIIVWPVLLTVNTSTAETLRYTYQRVVEDVVTLNDDIDVPQEQLPLVTYCLAARLADLVGDSTPTAQRVIARSETMLRQYEGFDRENYVRFEPAGPYG